MSEQETSGTSRRDFLKHTGSVVGAAALVGGAVPHVYASEDSTIQVALVGCGSRGNGAAANALSVKNGPTKLVAMADVFEKKLEIGHKALSNSFESQVDVPEGRRFLGFDGYKQAIDCLRPGDVVILTTPPAFRWVHFKYAIDKGVNVFMEKPVTVDGPASRKMLDLAEESTRQNLKVGVGLMCRHCHARQELHDRIKDGQIGDVLELRAYRMAGPTGSAASGPKPADMSELLYQIQRFHSFLWASGGAYSDFLIHNIDECCWMKDAWPVKAEGAGGRHYRGDDIDQNFDNYNVEYTFADGSKLFLRGRTMAGCHQEFASYAHGSKGAAVISAASHWPSRARIYKGWDMSKQNVAWQCNKERPEDNPYQVEWEDLIDAIRNDKPYNEVKRGVEASLVTSMGRLAAHTGQIVTFDDMLHHDHEFAPDVDKLSYESPAPLQLQDNGKYPVPMPGILKDREYMS